MAGAMRGAMSKRSDPTFLLIRAWVKFSSYFSYGLALVLLAIDPVGILAEDLNGNSNTQKSVKPSNHLSVPEM